MLWAFLSWRYSARPSAPFFSAHTSRVSRCFTKSINGTVKPHESEMRVALTRMIERVPGLSGNHSRSAGTMVSKVLPIEVVTAEWERAQDYGVVACDIAPTALRDLVNGKCVGSF